MGLAISELCYYSFNLHFEICCMYAAHLQ